MPTLLEILDDPSYKDANLATKQAIFNKYAPLDPSYESANEATKAAIQQKFGLGAPVSKPEPTEQKSKPEEDESIFRSIADVPLSVGRGAVQGVRFLADTFGADNPISNALRGTEDYIGDLMSAGAKRDAEEIGRIMKEAEDKGVGAQLAAALEALTVAPVDLISQALGTAAPTILGGIAGFAIKGGLKAGATAAQIASGSKLAGQIGAGVGGAMGAGVVKSTIYDAVEDALIEAGEKPEVAKAKAVEAQEYTGDNWGSILAGTALGGLAGVTGIEKNIVGRFSAKQAAKETAEQNVAKEAAEQTIVGAAAKEAAPEALQAGQEQLAANLALQGEIDPRTNLPFDVPTFRGVVGQAALEGLLGAGLGAGVEATGRLTKAVKSQTIDTTTEDLQTELTGDETEEGGEPKKILSPAQQFKALDPATLPQDKLVEIKDYLTKITTGEIAPDDAEKKSVLLNYSRQLGVPLPKRNSAKTLENAFNRLITKAFGEEGVDELGAGIGGEGTQVPGQPEETAAGSGTTEAGAGTVGTPSTPAGGAETGAAGVDTTLKGAGKFDKLAGLSKTAKTKTKKISTYADTKPLTDDELAFLQEVRSLEKAGEIIPTEYKTQAEQLNQKLGETVETVYNEAASSTDLKARGLPSQYTRRKGVEGGALTEDERLFFEDALGTSTDTDSVNQALAALSDYRDSKAAYAKDAGIRADARTDSIAAYEMNRKEESERTGITFPRWTDLTTEEQQAFIGKVPFKQDTGPSGESIQAGFDTVRTSLEATRAQQRDLEKSETEVLKDQEAQAYARQRQEVEDIRFGLSGTLPSDLSDSIKSGAYKEGKSQPLISYLSKLARGATPKVNTAFLEQAEQQVAQAELEMEQLLSNSEALSKAYSQGTDKEKAILARYPEFLAKQQKKVNAARRRVEKAKSEVDPFTAKIYRMVANVIGAQSGLNTKVVYVSAEDFAREGLSEEFVADYNPETDTIRVSDRGLNEQALLHEYVHAATINVIWKFLNGKRNELTAEQRRGVTQLLSLYNNINGRFKAELKAKRNPVIDNALIDIYEFVSYGLTNPEFQAELQKLKVRRYKTTIKSETAGTVEVEPVFYTDYFADDADIVDEAVAKALTTNEELRNLRDAATKENASEEVKEKWKEAKTKIAEGAKKPDGTQTAWQDFVHSVARVIGLTSRLGRAIRNFVAPREYLSRIKPEPPKTAKEVFEQVYGEGAKDFIDSALETTEEEADYTPQQKQAIKAKEKADVNLRNASQDIQSLYEKVGSSSEKLREHPDYKKLNQAVEKAQAKYDAAVDKLEDLGIKDEFAPGETQYENRQRVATTFEPGYLGNVFLELMGAFSEIAAAPEPVPNWSEGNVNIKGKPKVAPPTSQQTGTVDSFADAQVKKLDNAAPSIGKRIQGLRKFLSTKQGWTEAIRYAQNYRVRLDKFQDMLMRTKSLVSSGPNQNNTGTAVSTSSGMAELAYQKGFYKNIDDANQILRKLSKATGKNVKQVLARLHAYAIFKHDPERRKVKFLRDAPLKSAQAVIDRDKIIDEVIKIDRVKLGEIAAEKEAEKYMKKLEILVAANLDTASSLADINNDAYNTLGPHTKAKIDNVFGKAFTGENLKLADELFTVLKLIEKQTITFNEESNYFSRPVKNLVDFYGFKSYFPFKGKSDMGPKDYQIDPFSQALSGELQDKQEAFDGRITDSDNPILNVINEASKSAMRVGRHRAGVTLSIKNNILNYKAGKKGINGKLVKKIKFEDRFDKKLNAELRRGKKNIFHYNDDGTIEIYEITDQSMLEAIKKPIQGENWFINTLGTATSFFGQMHTRYNPAFAPVDFLRNLFTYAGIIGSEAGATKGLKVLAEMAKLMVAENVFYKTARFSWAYSGGDEATINRLAKKDKFYADLKNYFEKGGRVSYVQGISYKENIMSAVEAADRNGVVTSFEGVSRVFDAWLDMFEMSTRVAAYRVIRAEYEKSMSKEDADIEAVAYTKNLANFEKMGLKGKEIGAAYMFFRPAATGAVRAVEALAPIKDVKKFITGNTAGLLSKIKEENKDVVGFTDADAQLILEDQGRKAKSAGIVTVALAGLGVFTYAAAVGLADDDEEGRNKTITDDPTRWVRFARFNTGLQSGGQDLVIQIPWGFGLGAFASMGSQLAAFGFGAQPVGKTFNNMIDAGFESFGAIPFSKIDKFEHPVNWAIDSVTPSALRPAVEWMSNMDGLGREIYNNRQSRNNDAYTGGDNIPELFKDAARMLYNITDGAVDWSPNTMYFFANNYFDAAARFSSFTYNMAEVTTGQKDFDFKTDTLLFDAYMKAPSNYDARQFSEVKEQVMEIDRKYRAYSTSGDYDRLSRYLENNPMDPSIVKFYNKFNSQIDKLRAAANQIRKDTTLSTKERNDQVRLLVKQQNQMKAAFVQAIGAYGIEPKSPYSP
jgi:hypothetical protein